LASLKQKYFLFWGLTWIPKIRMAIPRSGFIDYARLFLRHGERGGPGPVDQEPPRLHSVIAREVTTFFAASSSSVEMNASRPQIPWRIKMKNHVYKILEIVGSSQTGIEDAIGTAIELAGKTVRNMDWFEVVETRGHIKDGKIGHYQVTLKIGFTLETQ